MPKEPKTKLEIDVFRERPKIREILDKLEREADTFKIPGALVSEIKHYTKSADLVPKKIDVNNRDSVDFAQASLQELQARGDRLQQILLSAQKFERVLGKLELLVKQELMLFGVLDHKSSGTSSKLLFGAMVPELADHQNGWQTLRYMVQHVQLHLGEAKDVIRMQIKLDENTNWSKRYNG